MPVLGPRWRGRCVAPGASREFRLRRSRTGHGRGDGGEPRGSHLDRVSRDLERRAATRVAYGHRLRPLAVDQGGYPVGARRAQGLDDAPVGRPPHRLAAGGGLADGRAESPGLRGLPRTPGPGRAGPRRRRGGLRRRRRAGTGGWLRRPRDPRGPRLSPAPVPVSPVQPARGRVRGFTGEPGATFVAGGRCGSRPRRWARASLRAHLGERLHPRRLGHHRVGGALEDVEGRERRSHRRVLGRQRGPRQGSGGPGLPGRLRPRDSHDGRDRHGGGGDDHRTRTGRDDPQRGIRRRRVPGARLPAEPPLGAPGRRGPR